MQTLRIRRVCPQGRKRAASSVKQPKINAKICKFLFARQFQFNDNDDHFLLTFFFFVFLRAPLFRPRRITLHSAVNTAVQPFAPQQRSATGLTASREQAEGREGVGVGEWIFEKWKSVSKLGKPL